MLRGLQVEQFRLTGRGEDSLSIASPGIIHSDVKLGLVGRGDRPAGVEPDNRRPGSAQLLTVAIKLSRLLIDARPMDGPISNVVFPAAATGCHL